MQKDETTLEKVVVARKLIQSYCQRLNDALDEYHLSHKIVLIPRTESDEIEKFCNDVLGDLVVAMPEAPDRWKNIELPKLTSPSNDSYHDSLNTSYQYWCQRRVVFQSFEYTLQGRLPQFAVRS
jgi:hypothetical protein